MAATLASPVSSGVTFASPAPGGTAGTGGNSNVLASPSGGATSTLVASSSTTSNISASLASSNWCLILNGNGIPLFSRSFGAGAAPSFPVMGLLSVVHSSALDSAQFAPSQLCSRDARIVYRHYDGTPSLLIVLSTSAIEANLIQLQTRIDQLHDALILLCGAAKLRVLKHTEAAKRQFQSLGDFLSLYLLEDPASPWSLLLSHRLRIPEMVVPASLRFFDFTALMARAAWPVAASSSASSSTSTPPLAVVASPTHSGAGATVPGSSNPAVASSSAGSSSSSSSVAVGGSSQPCAALASDGRLLACNREWSCLEARDMVTLATYIRSLAVAKARDITIYLPHSLAFGATHDTRGQHACRLVTVAISTELDLWLLLPLAGGRPTLSEIIRDVRSSLSTQMCRDLAEPRAKIQFDTGLISFIYIFKDRRVICSLDPMCMASSSTSASSQLPPTVITSRARTMAFFVASVGPMLATVSHTVTGLPGHTIPASPMATMDGKSSDAYMRIQRSGAYALRRSYPASSSTSSSSGNSNNNSSSAPASMTSFGTGGQTLYCLFSDAVPFAAYAGVATRTLVMLERYMSGAWAAHEHL